MITCLEDVKKINTSKPLFVVIQSTFPQTKANAIYEAIESLKEKDQEVVVANKLCNSTTLRRDELENLAKKVDCIVVIGGKTSSNTEGLRLYAQNFKKPVFLINSKEEIPLEIYDYESVGIATGTSTPQFIIDEIVDTLKGDR
jgi:4-hydroxy-3-methylbut-2-enyl diphosphate reductase